MYILYLHSLFISIESGHVDSHYSVEAETTINSAVLKNYNDAICNDFSQSNSFGTATQLQSPNICKCIVNFQSNCALHVAVVCVANPTGDDETNFVSERSESVLASVSTFQSSKHHTEEITKESRL